MTAKPWSTGDPQYTRPANRPPFVGINYHGLWDDYISDSATGTRRYVLDAIVDAGIDYVRFDISWAALQPVNRNSWDLSSSSGVLKLDKMMEELSDRGLKTLLMFYIPPAWSSGTTSKSGVPGGADYPFGLQQGAIDYGNALGWVGNRYKDQNLFGIEMWNEPNLSDYWRGAPNAAQFGNLIKTAYPLAKAAAPTVQFLCGAPSYVGVSWYQQLLAVPGFKNSFDGVCVHPYMSPSNLSPTYNPGGSHVWNLYEIPKLAALLAAQDVDTPKRKIYATEFGWSVHGNSPSAQNWELGIPDELTHSQFILDAANVMGQMPEVAGSFYYVDREMNQGATVHERQFGVLHRISATESIKKPSYYALKCAASGVCAVGDGAQTPPSTPTSFTAAGETQSTVRLNWAYDNSVDATVDRFRIYRYAGDGSSTPSQVQPSTGVVTKVGNIDTTYLAEISGLAASIKYPGILWAHSDTQVGGTTRIIGINSVTGATVATITGLPAMSDFECIGVGKKADGTPVIYAGDVGNNAQNRSDLKVVMFDEPATLGNVSVASGHNLKTILFGYQDDNLDCEGMLVDPTPGGKLWLVRKSHGTTGTKTAVGIFEFPAGFRTAAGPVVITQVPNVGTREAVSDAGLSHDGTRMFVNYRYNNENKATFAYWPSMTNTTSISLVSANMPQTEAMCWSLDDQYLYQASEGSAELWRLPAHLTPLYTPPAPIPAVGTLVAEVLPQTRTALDTGRATATTYSYDMLAYSTTRGPSPSTPRRTATTLAEPPPDPAPSAPTATAATATGQTTIEVSWTPVSGATSYKFFRGVGSGVPPTSFVGATVQNFWKLTGLTPDTTYSFRVSAMNLGGDGPLSNIVTATTLPVPPPPDPDPDPDPPPIPDPPPPPVDPPQTGTPDLSYLPQGDLYVWRSPTRTVRVRQKRRDKIWWTSHQTGITMLRFGDVWKEVQSPTQEYINSADVWLPGGRPTYITADQALSLIQLGYGQHVTQYPADGSDPVIDPDPIPLDFSFPSSTRWPSSTTYPRNSVGLPLSPIGGIWPSPTRFPNSTTYPRTN